MLRQVDDHKIVEPWVDQDKGVSLVRDGKEKGSSTHKIARKVQDEC